MRGRDCRRTTCWPRCCPWRCVVAEGGTGPGRGRAVRRPRLILPRMIMTTRIGRLPPGNPAGDLAQEVMGADWRRERCLLAAGAVLSRTAAAEHDLDTAVSRLPTEALID